MLTKRPPAWGADHPRRQYPQWSPRLCHRPAPPAPCRLSPHHHSDAPCTNRTGWCRSRHVYLSDVTPLEARPPAACWAQPSNSCALPLTVIFTFIVLPILPARAPAPWPTQTPRTRRARSSTGRGSHNGFRPPLQPPMAQPGASAACPPPRCSENAEKKSSAIFLAAPSTSREPTCASLPPTLAFTS